MESTKSLPNTRGNPRNVHLTWLFEIAEAFVAFGGVTWWMERKSTPGDLVTSLLGSSITSL